MFKRTLSVAANSDSTITLPDNALVAFVEDVEYASEPTAGQLTLEYRSDDNSEWHYFRAGRISYPEKQDIAAYVKNHLIRQVRVTNDTSEPVTVQIVFDSRTAGGLDERSYGGNVAINMQNFVESNIKNGTQWEVQFGSDTVGAGQSICIIFTTGSEKALIKSVIPTFLGDSTNGAWYRAPTFTGATSTPFYNPNDDFQAPKEITLQTGVTGQGLTVSNYGAQVSPLFQFIGDQASSVNQRTPTTSVRGFERVLRANSVYLLRLQNTTDAAIKMRLYATWYEGDLSTDL